MKLNFKQFGEGEKNLVILHGLLGSLDNWQSLAKRFGEQYNVFTLDQRNHGQSPHSAEMNYQLMSDDLLEFIHDHHIDSPVLLGHSMGGKTVMKFAFDHASLLGGLIVADMSPKAYPVHHQQILDALASVDFETVNSRKEVEEILMTSLKNRGVVQFLAKNVYWEDKEKLGYRFNLHALNEHIEEISGWSESGSYTGDTLFLKGQNSDYIEMHDVNIERQFPNCVFEEIEKAGHWLHADQPDAFYQVVHDFMEDL